jgi:hypothetical protein
VKNVLLFLVAALFLSGCIKQAESTAASTNANVDVERLFTADGCTVYRFYDNGEHHYFSKCKGAIRSEVDSTVSRSCGKGCTTDIPDTIVTN